jgi:hypothetical protein
MTSKTPKFDAALGKYFTGLELDEKGGQWRTCRLSGGKFYVRPDDVTFYKKMKVPFPTLSPRERTRRKLAFFNSYNLFRSTSAFSGKKIVSTFSPRTPHKIYEHQVWFGEKWDPFDYGREYDRAKGFFDQFNDFQLTVPLPNLFITGTSVNSDYANNVTDVKDCYIVFDARDCENCSYSISVIGNKSCVDCFDVLNSTNCYDAFESENLYNCFFVEYAKNCLDSYFLFDCRDCEHCFGGANLRHKKYVFFNRQLTKEDYEKEIGKINLGNRDVLNAFLARFRELKRSAIYKQDRNDKSVNSYGDFIISSKNCYACRFAYHSENLAYSLGGSFNRDSYDICAVNTEFSYETVNSLDVYHILFSTRVNGSRDMEYCSHCLNCHDCFGCIGFRNKSFCIFNKPYAEEEYWEMVDEIKTKMLEGKEYGEFFPPELSPIPYNISIATSYRGYDDIEAAKEYGYRTEEIHDEPYETEGELVKAEDVPKDIKDVADDILDKVILDEANNKKIRYVKAELDFYRKNNLPLPLVHYSARLKVKRDEFGTIAFELYERTCSKCGKQIQSAYVADDSRTIYCNACYLEAVV